jgi:hypothetical protein
VRRTSGHLRRDTKSAPLVAYDEPAAEAPEPQPSGGVMTPPPPYPPAPESS